MKKIFKENYNYLLIRQMWQKNGQTLKAANRGKRKIHKEPQIKEI